MGKRPKQSLIPVRGKPKPGQPQDTAQPKVPPPRPEPHPQRKPTGNQRGR